MNKSATRKAIQAGCVIFGVAIAIACQHTSAQSVSPGPPTGNAKAAAFIKSQLASAESQLTTLDAAISKSQLFIDTFKTKFATLEMDASKMSVSKESYPEVLKTLHSQRVQLSIDLAGIEARFKAIQAAMAKLIQQQTDSELKPLQEIIKKQEAQVALLKAKLAQGDEAENLYQIEISLLESKSRLAQLKTPQGGLFSHLNQHLLDTTLERAEKIARLEKANQLIEGTDEYRSNLDQTRQFHREFLEAVQKWDGLNQERSQIAENIKLLQAELGKLDAYKD